ncbi:hypothetical protein IGI39_001066 [Enterococcus sp. AZ135]|uniref:Mur ligase family protein n=1 Tax=unclassified Enterococcus TaxID=2608891 RepID=UPI003F20C62F
MVQTKREILDDARQFLEKEHVEGEEIIIYVSTCNSLKRGEVWRTSGTSFNKAWNKVDRYLNKFLYLPKWIKIEIQVNNENVVVSEGIRRFARTKRNNYFSKGIAFKKDGSCSFLADEISGNALLTPVQGHKVGSNSAQLELNINNIKGYIKRRFHRIVPDPLSYFDAEWTLFETVGIFIEEGKWYPLETNFFGRGMREITLTNQVPMLESVIEKGSYFLFDQMTEEGKFTYGYYPAYDHLIPGYNSVRHFSSLYALLETIEYSKFTDSSFKDELLIEKIENGLDWGLKNLCLNINETLFVGEKTKNGYELKLGAQALAVLAISKYETLTGNEHYHQIILNLLQGITSFITDDGRTLHVLNEDLTVKEEFRIIYYDGEALFAIMQAYPLVGEDYWLSLAESLMDQYVANGYETYHDHWLSYSVNELTKYLPKREYFEFGVKNALENLLFMEKRDTAYPTFLELLCAAIKMFYRIEKSEYAGQLFSNQNFQRLLEVAEKRAFHEMRTGVMWPEYALYFANPQAIVSGFYARHDRTRMRIDDAEHFLSGLINYRYLFDEKEAESESILADAIPSGEQHQLSSVDNELTRHSKKQYLGTEDFYAFSGWFLDEEVAENLVIQDFEYYPANVPLNEDKSLAFIDLSDEKISEIIGKSANWPSRKHFIQTSYQHFGLLVTDRPMYELKDTVPQFIVPDVWEFMHEVSSFLRRRFDRPVVAITGSVGKSSVRLMLEHVLTNDFSLMCNRGNHNTRLAIPLYMNKLVQDPDIALLEMSLNALNSRDRGTQSRLVEPTIALLTSIDFAHMRGTKDLSVIAKVKSRIFEGLTTKGIAIINHDMDNQAFEIAMEAAISKRSKIMTYSMKGSENADLRVIQLKMIKSLTEVTVEYQNRFYTYHLTISSEGMAENSLAVFLTIVALGLKVEDYLSRLMDFRSLPKVMALHSGRLQGKEVVIIDDTHNAAIPSMINGIRTFSQKAEYFSGKKILALGQVADLGDHTEKLHRQLIPFINHAGADIFLAYGEGMREIVAEVDIPALYFDEMNGYVSKILEEITDQSLVLLKGSVSGSDYHKVSDCLVGMLKTEMVNEKERM